jgi:pSer/pThr/pTyr-binding forkhead associated (FHA) protein
MDDVNQPPGQPVQGLRLHGAAPANFRPLRLLLLPSGASIDVNRPDMLVGRHTECDIRLPLPDVSRRHCRLQFVEGGWQVTDLNSLNGIQVNGEQVLQAPLEQGDQLRIGSFIFTVDLTRQDEPPGSNDQKQSVLQTLATSPRRRAS